MPVSTPYTFAGGTLADVNTNGGYYGGGFPNMQNGAHTKSATPNS